MRKPRQLVPVEFIYSEKRKNGTGSQFFNSKKYAALRHDRRLRFRHNPSWCSCARIVCVACMPFVFRPTSLRGKENCCGGTDGVGKDLLLNAAEQNGRTPLE